MRTTRAGAPVHAAVSIGCSMPAMGMPDLHVRLRETSAGVAAGSGVTLTMPGTWRLDVTVRPRGDDAFAVRVTDVVRL